MVNRIGRAPAIRRLNVNEEVSARALDGVRREREALTLTVLAYRADDAAINAERDVQVEESTKLDARSETSNNSSAVPQRDS